MRPPWFRCHRVARHPLAFNTSRLGRFNAPHGEYGILYLGTDPFCAFIETFGRTMRRNDVGVSLISEPDLAARRLRRIDARAGWGSFRIIDLTGAGLARIGADARLHTTTTDRALPQRWALALWRHPQRPDGLLYRVRHDPERIGIALFDRVGDVLTVDDRYDALADPDLLAAILARYRFALNPAGAPVSSVGFP